MTITIATVFLTLLSILTTCIGFALAWYFTRSVKGIGIGLGFSAGIMLLISFFHLLPKAIDQTSLITAVTVAIVGGLVIAYIRWVIPKTPFFDSQGEFIDTKLRTAYLVALGLILHDIPEGFAMANAFVSSETLGIALTLAILMHKIPEQFALAAPIIVVEKKQFLLIAALLSSLALPLGAMIGFAAVHVFPGLNALFLAFAAGVMIFVTLRELLPTSLQISEVHYFILGISLSAGVYFLLYAAAPA